MADRPAKTIIINTGNGQADGQDYEAGVLLNFNHDNKGFVNIELLMVLDKKQTRSFKKMPFDNVAHTTHLPGMPHGMLSALKKITREAMIAHLVKSGYAYLKNSPTPLYQLNAGQIELLNNLRYEVLQELKYFSPVFKNTYHLPKGEIFGPHSLKPASLSVYVPSLAFALTRQAGWLQLHCFIVINNQQFPLTGFERNHFLLRSRSEYFILQKQDISTLDIFKEGMLQVTERDEAAFIADTVKPLMEKYPVDLGDIIKTEIIDEEPAAQVFVSELNENFLLIKLQWLYGEFAVEDWDESETIIETGSTVYKVIRKKQPEQALIATIRQLHSKFAFQSNGYFHLNFKEALQQNWFVRFYNTLRDAGIPVFGMQQLRKFKYNPHAPVITISTGNRIDWFDITVQVSYGGMLVPLQELRKAIINRQQFILLEDGSLGMLPEEWINKYALMMRLGQVKEGVLQLPATNWTIVDQLQDQFNDAALQARLEDRKKRFQAIDNIATHAVPAAITATLRDYQQAGFQWLCLLDELGWGGCLADDMGLGKTLQTICFLQWLTQKYPNETQLVVCPTSLIYNWENELKKFAPGIDYHIHYGADRVFDRTVFDKAHIIITSYGMLRSDMEHFSEYTFGYVVLDESQAIKNPASQVTKAVQALQARNRIALSGTPVQNNTQDLYAQMHFLNPGMLGSREFFKTVFANPIDKYSDPEKTAALRRLIYPFMLRRTKEQVARDLPDKTEIILWCEMNSAQRKIYDSFKEHYRQSILGHIEEEGMGKSSIYILEGLTKLRQICDSPAILNEETVYANESIKLEELTREIEENTGAHKVLVFSQFTSMLQLAAQSLQQKGIACLYLDGGTTAEHRKKAVQQFQEDASVRVFLISLKAGGVGLTLTAADYVYLVDPWWNPAVEMQAIDRTHRIGQVKKVFAYRMICKDSVEEKILLLQEKKKALAAGLVTDESGFVKKLTKEDISYLFS